MSYVLKVALLEDEIASRTLLLVALASEGYDVTHVIDEEELDGVVAKNRISVVVIGSHIEHEQATKITERLTSTHPTLWLIRLSKTDLPEDRISCYNHGVHLCICGPSLVPELAAALRMTSRRVQATENHHASIYLICDRREITGCGAVTLNGVEVTLLKALGQAADRQLAYFRLLELFETDLNAKSKCALEVHIARLRKKLIDVGATAPAIRAIRNEGYQLTETVLIR